MSGKNSVANCCDVRIEAKERFTKYGVPQEQVVGPIVFTYLLLFAELIVEFIVE